MANKAVFFDRDGTLNVDIGYLHRPEDFEWIPGAVQAIRYVKENGFLAILVTNQSGVARGYYPESDIRQVYDWMNGELEKAGVRLDGLYYCPHHPEGKVAAYRRDCACRKPGTLLVDEACREHDIDRKQSYFVGDSEKDMECASRAGLTGIHYTGGSLLDKVREALEHEERGENHADIMEKEYMKCELIDGREVMMSPANTNHLTIQGNLHSILHNYLKGKRCKLFFEHKVVFEESKNWFQPDIAIVCDRSKIKRTHIDGAPDFIAEILSPATQMRDFGIKKDTYERCGVREYWIIDPQKESVMVHLLKDGRYVLDNIYQNFTAADWEDMTEEERAEQQLTLKLSLYEDLEIEVKEIFEDLYYE